jgi:hypothetical protein
LSNFNQHLPIPSENFHAKQPVFILRKTNMMDVFDSQPPTKLHNLGAAMQQKQLGQTPMTLPEDYSPRDHDICCGRGKRNWNHKGNVYFRNLIQANVDRYLTATTKTGKTAVVLTIVDEVRLGGTYFVKQNDDNGRWYDIGDAQAREKVGHSLRDQVTAWKKSSKRSDEDEDEPVIPAAALSASAPPAYAMQQQQQQQPMGYPYSDQQPNNQYVNDQYQNPFPNYTELDNVHSMTKDLMHRHLSNEVPQPPLLRNFSSDYLQRLQQNAMQQQNPMQQQQLLSADYLQQQQHQQQQQNPMQQQLSADYPQQQHQQQQNHLQQHMQSHITADFTSSLGPPQPQNMFPPLFSSDNAQFLPPQRRSSFSLSDYGGDTQSDVRKSDSTTSQKELQKFGRRPSWRAMSISSTHPNHLVDEMHQLQHADFDTDDDDFEDVKNFIMSVGGPSQGSRRRSSKTRISDPRRLSNMSLGMSIGTSVGSFSDMGNTSFSNPYRSSIRRSSVAWMKEMNDQFDKQYESNNMQAPPDRRTSTLDMLKVLQDMDFDGL